MISAVVFIAMGAADNCSGIISSEASSFSALPEIGFLDFFLAAAFPPTAPETRTCARAGNVVDVNSTKVMRSAKNLFPRRLVGACFIDIYLRLDEKPRSELRF